MRAPKSKRAQKATVAEVARLEEVLARRRAKVEEAEAKLAAAKERAA